MNSNIFYIQTFRMSLSYVLGTFVFAGKYTFRREEIEDYLSKHNIYIDNLGKELDKLVSDRCLFVREVHNRCVLFKGRKYELREGENGFGYYLVPTIKSGRVRGNRIRILKKKVSELRACRYWKDNEYRVSGMFISKKIKLTV